MGFFVDKSIVLRNKLPSNFRRNDTALGHRGWWSGTGHDNDYEKLAFNKHEKKKIYMRSKGKLDEWCVGKERNSKKPFFYLPSDFAESYTLFHLSTMKILLRPNRHGSQYNPHFIIHYLCALYLSKWGICVRGRKYSIVSGLRSSTLLRLLTILSYQFRLYGRKSFPPWWYRTPALMIIFLSVWSWQL